VNFISISWRNMENKTHLMQGTGDMACCQELRCA
jgi:hypothetical protein